MFQNLKVDIIYYKTNTDFEMEFNLCGCCRMRLLTDKSPDKKTFVHSLARAVSRSRVIIVVGNLFGQEGTINLVAAATGKGITTADNKMFGISGESEIEIISGSTPLVTADGYFGGCIIESGPQTMILLSDGKTVRKNLMNNLIHPYIEELCATDIKEKVSDVNEENEEENVEPLEEIPLVVEDIEAEAEEEIGEAEAEADTETADEENFDFLTQEQADEDYEYEYEKDDLGLITGDDSHTQEDIKPIQDDIPIIMDQEIEMENSQEDIFENDGEDFELFFEPDDMRLAEFYRRNREYYNGGDTLNGLVSGEEDEDEDKIRRPRSTFGIPILVLATILLIVLAILCYHIFYIPARDGVTAAAFIKETFDILLGN